MSVWDVIEARAKPLAEGSGGAHPGDVAFWHLIGLLQGLHDGLPDEPAMHPLGQVILDALDRYERELDVPPF